MKDAHTTHPMFAADDAERYLADLVTSPDERVRVFGRLIATGFPAVLQTFLRDEIRRGTSRDLILRSILNLAANVTVDIALDGSADQDRAKQLAVGSLELFGGMLVKTLKAHAAAPATAEPSPNQCATSGEAP